MRQGVGQVVVVVVTLATSLVSAADILGLENLHDPEVLSLTTGEFDVPHGDWSECFYTRVTTMHELAIVAASGRQSPHGHHITAYYTDTPRDPEHHPCTSEEMVGWRRVAGATGRGVQGKGLELPKGLAMKVPAGKQLVIQSHYINTTISTIKATDTITLHLANPAHVQTYANMFYFFNNEFEIPAQSSYQSVTSCTVPRDLRIVQLAGHMHEFGTDYRLEQGDSLGQKLTTLYKEDWSPSSVWNPPVLRYSLEEPLILTAGTRLRQTCQWHNPTEQPLRYPREMCIAIFLYFPDEGPLFCQPDPS